MDERTSKSAVGANHPESIERTPIYVPVIHTQTDMGALSEAIQRWKVKKLGRKGWDRYVRLGKGKCCKSRAENGAFSAEMVLSEDLWRRSR
jgi:hypothetical protein